MPAPILYESHCHTPLCRHAVGEPEEYAAAAEQRGLKGIIFTCHCPLPDRISYAVRMTPEEYPRYIEIVARARAAFAGRMDVRLGLESDFYPGVEPWLEQLHAAAPLNFVLGSVHTQVPDYRARYLRGDWFDYQQTYFEHLAQAAETGLYDALAHPDLVKNEAPDEWILPRIEPFILRALDRIARTGVAMELNTSGINKALPEMNPGAQILAWIHERGIPMVIGADAHRPSRVADGYETGLKQLAGIGFREINIFLERKRQPISIEAALASLRSLPVERDLRAR
jgi:histidinol-phosphatase (PHP family)